MAKELNFSYKGKDYTLGFTRNTVRQLEATGFVARDIEAKPALILPDLFAGAFLAHHKYVKRDVIDEIYRHLPDKDGLVKCLAEMYSEPIEALMSEPEDGEENVNWVKNW